MGGSMSRFNPDKDMIDLTGKVAIVTGANKGIGYHTAKFLARKGAKVYLGARNESKASGAIFQLEQEGLGRGQVLWLKVDLSDPRLAKESAEDFLRRESRLDILVNNAAQLLTPYEKTQDGISSIMAVNHFSTFVFTRILLPILTKTSLEPGSDVRIVTLSSRGHSMTRADEPGVRFRNLEDFNREFAKDLYPEFSRYVITKLTNILFARELQKRLDDSKIAILSIPIHPGGVDTFANSLPWPILGGILMKIFFVTPEIGSFTSCFAAASPLVKASSKYKHAYLVPVGRIGKLGKNVKDDLAVELWESTEKILGDLGLSYPDVPRISDVRFR